MISIPLPFVLSPVEGLREVFQQSANLPKLLDIRVGISPELRTLGTILLSLRSLGKKNLCLAGFANTADIVSMSFLNVHPSLPPQHLISKINPIIQAGAPALTGSKSN
jgi:hypothetical protein